MFKVNNTIEQGHLRRYGVFIVFGGWGVGGGVRIVLLERGDKLEKWGLM